MKRCHAADELVRDFGPPDHRVPQGDLEIWHYPLGVIGGFLYSIHAVTREGELTRVYTDDLPKVREVMFAALSRDQNA